MKKIKGPTAIVETRTLDKHVESLRRKVVPCAEFISTVHGVGYLFSPQIR